MSKKKSSSLVSTQVRDDLAARYGNLEDAVKQLEAYVVDSEPSMHMAVSHIKDSKRAWQDFEDKRKSVTAPLNAAVKEVNSWFSPLQNGLKQIESILKQKISDFQTEQSNAQVAAMNAISEGQSNELVIPVDMPKGISTRMIRGFEITDADAVPREYCSPDSNKICKAMSDGIAVSGVRFYSKPVVTVKT